MRIKGLGRNLRRTLAAIAIVPAALAAGTAMADELPLPRAKPEEVGISSERLARIGAALNADIESGRIPGAVIAVARRGKIVLLEAYGWRDKEARVPMTTDTIFNIASMTKPMTAVGALMLYEQGRLLMDEPVANTFKGFADDAVAARDANGEPTAETVPAQRQITIQDLLRHTSGIIYGGRGTTLVHKMYPDGSAAASKMTRPRIHRQACVIAAAASARRGLGLRFRSRCCGPCGRGHQQTDARRLSPGKLVGSARYDRHRVLYPGGKGCPICEAFAGRSGIRQTADDCA